MTRALIIAVVLGAASPVSLVAQKQDDTVHTAAGVCRVWALPPGGSNFPEDASYNRCALERAPVLRPDQPMPPPPRHGTSGFISVFVVVNPDGTVDPGRTRPWSNGMDAAFNAGALETVRTWRFEPGTRGGVPVRSAFTIQISTGSRVDTLPARLTWLDWDGTGTDTLRGTWVHDSSLPPFTPSEADSVHAALLRRLVQMQVVIPRDGQLYCLVLERGDSADQVRLSSIASRAARTAGHRGWFTPPGCERNPEHVRLVLPRIHRTEDGRAVLYPKGDHLPNWPTGADGVSWRAWNGRCVVLLPGSGSATADCSVEPYYAMGDLGARFRDRDWYRHGARVTPGADDDSVLVRVIATTHGAFQSDTLRAILPTLPTLSAGSVIDTVHPCGGWSAHSPEGARERYTVHGDPRARHLIITRVSDRPLFDGSRGERRCPEEQPRPLRFTAFLAGGLGEFVSLPVTLCFSRCAKSYVLEPGRHTLAPSVRVRLADLREHTRTGDQVALRILVDPPPENLMPVVIVRMSGKLGSSWADIPRRTGPNSWDYFVRRTPGYSPDAELFVYLVRRQ